MVGRIKDKNARNNYAAYAAAAARAERGAEYTRASALWAQAAWNARGTGYRRWAENRAEFCTNAAHRGWGVPDERGAV